MVGLLITERSFDGDSSIKGMGRLWKAIEDSVEGEGEEEGSRWSCPETLEMESGLWLCPN